MNTFGKYIEFAYAIIGIVFIADGAMSLGNEEQKPYFKLGFGVLAIFMFLFKRNFRKRRS